MRKFIQRKTDDKDSDPLDSTERTIVFKKNPSENGGITFDKIEQNEESFKKSPKPETNNQYAKITRLKPTHDDNRDKTHSDTMQKLKKSIDLAKSARSGLSNRVTEKSKKIEDAKKQLERKQQEVKQLLEQSTNSFHGGVMKHSSKLRSDLPAPLSVIKTRVDLMGLTHDNTTDRIKLESLDNTEKAIQKILNQLNNVVGFVSNQKYSFAINDVLDIVKSSAIQADIPFGVKLMMPNNSCLIDCDSSKLKSVFQNIITNAVQAIGPSGSIIASIKEDNENCIIRIEDSGPGISPENIDKIFEPFFTTKIDGNGLGLARCKEIIENHRGKISVENNPTAFIINLPKLIK